MIIIPGQKQTIEQTNHDLDEAQTWVFNKSAELSKLSQDHDESIYKEVNSDLYVDEPSYADGSNPMTLTNQKKDFFETISQAPNFVPPSPTTADAWGGYLEAFKKTTINNSIQTEANVKMHARKNKVKKTIDMMATQISENPGLYESSVDLLNTTLHENHEYIPANYIYELKDYGMQEYQNAEINGFLKNDPGELIHRINNKFYDTKSEDELKTIYKRAALRYQTTNKADIDYLCESLEGQCQKIIDNGGSMEGVKLTTFENELKYHDGIVKKLATLAPWFNLDPDGPRTKDNESQRTVVEKYNGQWYIAPSIRWSGDSYMTFDNQRAVKFAVENGDAIPVENLQQGNRISRWMSRLLWRR